MTYFQAAVLAILQGVTEFLPISSSAHLILLPRLVGWEDQGLAFDVAVNTGSLIAVMIYFRRELLEVLRGGLALLTGGVAGWRRAFGGEAPGASAAPDAVTGRLALALALGTVPVAVVGLLAYDTIAGPLRSPLVIAWTSIGFGLLLWVADRWGRRLRELDRLTVGDAALVGLAQALALIPGTSRSGVTMTAALARGFTREAAARFSFLLAVPVGILAGAKDLVDLVQGEIPAGQLGPMALAFVLSGLSAYLVIGWLLAWLRRQDMGVFVIYRVALGALLLILF